MFSTGCVTHLYGFIAIEHMKHFLSCDWGTSSFRLRLVDAFSVTVIAEITSSGGIAATYHNWQSQKAKNRADYFNTYISAQVQHLQQQTDVVLNNLVIIISGMISSAIGMVEFPYKLLPFNATAEELPVYTIESTNTMPHKTLIVSGVCSANDVMRGEETIVAGCIDAANNDLLLVLPGTHSKHVTVSNGRFVGITTYMTGELFALLSEKSVLAGSVEKNENIVDGDSFYNGLHDAGNGSVLHNIFNVRTNALLKQTAKQQNFAYLSGLLIGEELLQLTQEGKQIGIVSSGSLLEIYNTALLTLFPNRNIMQFNANTALVKAHAAIFLHNQ